MPRSFFEEKMQDIQKEIEKVRDSLLEIVEAMGPVWCSKVIGCHVNYFYNFKNSPKHYKGWSTDQVIKIYDKLYEAYVEALKEVDLNKLEELNDNN